jgi:hypothetical protein
VNITTVVMSPWTWREMLRACVCYSLQHSPHSPYCVKSADSPTGHTANCRRNQRNI